jgi:hypothetical protein
MPRRRRTAPRCAASCLAGVVFPAPGNPQMRISRASVAAEGGRGHADRPGARRCTELATRSATR